jgi:hypothetical protein
MWKLVTVFSGKLARIRLTNAVTGTLFDLKTVGKSLALAEVDKVGLITCEVSKELAVQHACRHT